MRVSGQWHNIGTRAYLDPRQGRAVTRFLNLPSSDDLLVVQWITGVDRLDRLLDGVTKGIARVSRFHIHYKTGLSHTDRAPERYRFHAGWSDFAGRMARDYVHWSALHLTGYGPTTSDLIGSSVFSRDRLDASLRVAADQP